MQGLFLGLADGTTCLAYCTPVLIPLLLSGGKKIRQNGLLMAQFLAGRLAGYLLFGVLAWLAGRLLLGASGWTEILVGFATIGLAVLMAVSAFTSQSAASHAKVCNFGDQGLRRRLHPLGVFIPLVLGFLTGLNLCPPFCWLSQGLLSAVPSSTACCFLPCSFWAPVCILFRCPFWAPCTAIRRCAPSARWHRCWYLCIMPITASFPFSEEFKPYDHPHSTP